MNSLFQLSVFLSLCYSSPPLLFSFVLSFIPSVVCRRIRPSSVSSSARRRASSSLRSGRLLNKGGGGGGGGGPTKGGGVLRMGDQELKLRREVEEREREGSQDQEEKRRENVLFNLIQCQIVSIVNRKYNVL